MLPTYSNQRINNQLYKYDENLCVAVTGWCYCSLPIYLFKSTPLPELKTLITKTSKFKRQHKLGQWVFITEFENHCTKEHDIFFQWAVIFLWLLGYGPVTDSSEKRPKEQSLGPEAPNVQSVTGYIKGVVQPAEPEPTVGVPTALPPTKGMPSFVTGWKRPKPQVPVFPQGYPSKPIVQEQSPMIPQNKASKPVQYIPQEQAPIPELAPLIPQAKPVVPALLPFAEQGKGPKPYTQVLQSAAPVYPQGNGPNPVTLQPAVPQNKGPKPAASVLLPVFLQTKGPKPVSPIPEIPQTKDTKPVAPEPAAPQTAGSVLSLEPTPAMPQMKGPKLANPGKNILFNKLFMLCMLKI